MSIHLRNRLLASLDKSALARIEADFSVVRLEPNDVIAEAHASLNRIYFPHEGVISCVVDLSGGGAIETGMIGNDGEFGAGAALDHKLSLNRVTVQIGGDMSVINADRARELVRECTPFRDILMSYEQFILAQAQQTAACNAVHRVQARACKWLIRMRELVGDEFALTQEFLAEMMGVRRSSVSEVAADLQRADIISYSRGRIKIIDPVKMQNFACECDAALKQNHRLIVGRF